jgi:hypothetical protein
MTRYVVLLVSIGATALVVFGLSNRSRLWPAARATDLVVKFDHRLHDFGAIRRGRDLVHEFRFANQGSAPVQIARLETGCACLAKSDYARTPIAPGSAGSVIASFSTANEEPPKMIHRLIRVHFTAADSRASPAGVVELALLARLEPDIEAHPASLEFAQVPDGDAARARKAPLTLRRNQLTADEFRTLRLTGPANVRIDEIRRTDDAVDYSVSLLPAAGPGATLPLEAKYRAPNPSGESAPHALKIPLRIAAPPSEVVVEPRMHFRRLASGGDQPVRDRLRLQSSRGIDLKIVRIEPVEASAREWLDYSVVHASGPQPSFEVWPTKVPQRVFQSAVLRVVYEDAGGERGEVPVTVRYSNPAPQRAAQAAGS